MRIRIDPSAWRTLGVLVGNTVAICATPVAILLTVGGHPDRFEILLNVVVLSIVCAASVWAYCFFLDAIRLSLSLVGASLLRLIRRLVS